MAATPTKKRQPKGWRYFITRGAIAVPEEIHTGGGASNAGDLHTGGGDFVGRDNNAKTGSVINNFNDATNRNYTITEYLYQKIQEHDRKIEGLERAIGGGSLGEEGIVQGLRELRRDAQELRRDVQLVKNFDDRLVRIEDLLVVSRSNDSLPKNIITGVIIAVVFSLIVSGILLMWGQGVL